MVLVHSFLQKVKQNTLEIGLKVSDMEMDLLNLSQVHFLKENSRMVAKMDMEEWHILQGIIMKEIGNQIKKKDKVLWCG